MQVEFSTNARNDIASYRKYSHMSINKVENYINSLLNYINHLSYSPYIGKVFFYCRDFEIRQLIFRKHRVFYYIEKEKVYILRIVHTSRNIDYITKYITSIF